MIIKGKKGDTFQELYPLTLGNNVILNNGETVQVFLNELLDKLPSDIPFWEGASYPSDTQTVTVSKPLSDCFRGWELGWQEYRDGDVLNQQIQYTQIPKTHLLRGAGGVRISLGKRGGESVSKYIYIDDTTITGHATNREGGNEGIVLTNIFEY